VDRVLGRIDPGVELGQRFGVVVLADAGVEPDNSASTFEA